MRPSIIGRVLGALEVRATLSRSLREMGAPGARPFESVESLRGRYKRALDVDWEKHAAAIDVRPEPKA